MISLALVAEPAFAQGCGEILFGRGYRSHVEGLVNGQKAYGIPASDFEIDPQTEYDLELDDVEEMLNDRLTTDFARRRWHYMLRHPLLDSEQIRARQILIRFIADDPERFAQLKAHLGRLSELERNFTKSFQDLEHESAPMVIETLWMAATILCYQAATIGKYMTLLSVSLQLLIIKRAYSQSLENALKRAWPRREILEPYRKMMISIKLMIDGLRGTPEGDEMANELSRVFRGPPTGFLSNLWARWNHFAAENSPGLVESVPPHLVDRSKGALNPLYRKFIFMDKIWSLPVPWFKKRVVVFDMKKTEDLFFVSNFRMRKMRKLVVQQKEQLAGILSAAADLEVMMAMADLYNENRHRMTFPEILDKGETSQVVFEQANHPSTVLVHPGASTPNDILLGHPREGGGNSFAVAAAGTGEGNSHFVRTIGTTLVLAQNGFPVLARAGKFTPALVVSALNLKDRLASGTSFSRAEAERWAMIERLPEVYPHAVVLMNDPFTVGRLEESEALKIEVVRKLILQPTIGVMITRSRDFLARIRDWQDVALWRMENRRLREFNFERDIAKFDPEVTFGTLEAAGVSAGFLEDARLRVYELRGGHLNIPDPVDLQDSRVSQDDPSERARARLGN